VRGAIESRVGTDGRSYCLTDLSRQFIWWQYKDDAFKLADNVQRIQTRRIKRDMLEVKELVRRCLEPLSGGDAGGDEGGSDNGSSGVVLAAAAEEEEADGREIGV
jgi:hypothetical protein